MQDINAGLFGKPNPNAPKELAQFAFLIGRWQGKGFQNRDGNKETYEMTWIGRYILDGWVIADESLVGPANNREAMFITYRSFDQTLRIWRIEALNILESTLDIQAANDLGGVQVHKDSISIQTPRTNAITREVFKNISANHFTYQLITQLIMIMLRPGLKASMSLRQIESTQARVSAINSTFSIF